MNLNLPRHEVETVLRTVQPASDKLAKAVFVSEAHDLKGFTLVSAILDANDIIEFKHNYFLLLRVDENFRLLRSLSNLAHLSFASASSA